MEASIGQRMSINGFLPALFRSSLAAVRNRISPIRTSLISVLSAIYPIDLASPSDLLYSILDVPLPIPLNGNEPAPPLSLPSRKDVTEDAVGTALGYAAHLVQLLAVYMGKGLVYPVTYVGSRSLIKDSISAMVGPRMSVFSRLVTVLLMGYFQGFHFSPKASILIALNMPYSY